MNITELILFINVINISGSEFLIVLILFIAIIAIPILTFIWLFININGRKKEAKKTNELLQKLIDQNKPPNEP